MTTPVTSVGAATATGAAGQSAAATNRSELDPQAFLQLLVAQLQYQDPSNPVDTSSFMQQTATLSQVQTMNSMASTLTSLANAQQAQAATELIGKSVTYADSSGAQKTGVVTSAALPPTGATVKVGDVDIPITQVLGVSAAPSAASA